MCRIVGIFNISEQTPELRQAAELFPNNPPHTKKEYYYRSIYSELFPGYNAAKCVPSLPSVECTPVTLELDTAFKAQNEPSGSQESS